MAVEEVRIANGLECPTDGDEPAYIVATVQSSQREELALSYRSYRLVPGADLAPSCSIGRTLVLRARISLRFS